MQKSTECVRSHIPLDGVRDSQDIIIESSSTSSNFLIDLNSQSSGEESKVIKTCHGNFALAKLLHSTESERVGKLTSCPVERVLVILRSVTASDARSRQLYGLPCTCVGELLGRNQSKKQKSPAGVDRSGGLFVLVRGEKGERTN
jgi:hypothetical protein